MARIQLSLAVAALFALLCAGQTTNWMDGQVNATMCQWVTPRAAVVRDIVYIDGGDLRWLPGMANGEYGPVTSDSNPTGLVYLLNFNTSFNIKDSNFSSLFSNLSKAAGGGNANNIAPQYYDGGMFANDYEWYTYGGELDLTDASSELDSDSVAKYMKYLSGPERQFQPGWQLDKLPENMTRYVTFGAAVSVPSENLGYYFGGMRSSTWGSIYTLPNNASEESLTLIEVDMGHQLKETWNNYTLPSSVPGRANAEIVWVPVSEKGVLVAIGGVINPSFGTITNNATAIAESERTSPGFMSTVSVYDINEQVWYEQETSGKGPGQLTQGCTVLASAQDGSSHNIYWYGGFDGLNPTEPDAFNDDVWVLSIPSFTWMRLTAGTIGHGRAGHRCVKPYPDQMFVIGGYNAASGEALTCIQDGFIRNFNLSSAEWLPSYDPEIWSEYSVPSTVYKTIGGSESGSASLLKPLGDGFSNDSMTALFGTEYNATKISKWYPYKVEEANNATATPLPKPVAKPSSGTPSYLGPVLGVILGLFFLTLIVLAVLLYRRRKYLKSHRTATQSEAGTMDNRRFISNWLRATPVDAKAPTVTTDETPMSAYEEEHQTYVQPTVPEMADGQVHEMMDTSRPVELHDTGFVPVHKHGKDRSLAASPSVTSHTSARSTVSGVSQNSAGRPGISPVGSPRTDSPDTELPSSDPQNRRIVSDMSGISETDRGHLRGISETSVSTVGAYATPMEGLGIHSQQGAEVASPASPNDGRHGVVSPLTPPEGMANSGDYLGAGIGSPSSPQGGSRRKSNFSEGLEENEKR